MGRIALGIEYDGAAVYGWQRQREVPSVQEHLEKALSTVANEPIEVQCAGRTDAGVHATGQVVHFNCDAPRSERAWTLGVNANLPNSVAVTWAKTKSPSENGLWFSMNDFSKHLPRNESVSGYDCCRIAVRKYTESYYKNNH